jgi:hypothetical protein
MQSIATTGLDAVAALRDFGKNGGATLEDLRKELET